MVNSSRRSSEPVLRRSISPLGHCSSLSGGVSSSAFTSHSSTFFHHPASPTYVSLVSASPAPAPSVRFFLEPHCRPTPSAAPSPSPTTTSPPALLLPPPPSTIHACALPPHTQVPSTVSSTRASISTPTTRTMPPSRHPLAQRVGLSDDLLASLNRHYGGGVGQTGPHCSHLPLFPPVAPAGSVPATASHLSVMSKADDL